ncbi:MAG: Alpha-1,3-mannosyltransferase-like protein [Thelocarpon impressellum]|nr:MAG: Alpha-1,3-mannosyltransferase-like protein [Thelocarpon impressellum]
MASGRKKKAIVFLHPDLGIGGAERLVVDAAVGLQKLGHTVTIFTSHCDPKHCFDEARDGTLDVRVRGNSLVPSNILGRFAILCAILRQLHLLLEIRSSGELSSRKPDAFFVDQLSFCIPFLQRLQPQANTLFYCHFPDKLLASRTGQVKRAYRVPFDWLEGWTTGLADGLVVNSKFTRGVFAEAFPGLRRMVPRVIYPCVDTSRVELDAKIEQQLWDEKKIILSINRFERKKGVELAIKAYAGLEPGRRLGVRLVLAGGYDPRVAENVSYHRELVRLADSLGIKSATTKTLVTALNVPADIDVLFLLSVPATLKSTLLHAAELLVYTPPNEHFGIVPLEAMLACTPVLAANSGGPLETILQGVTGWHRPVDDVEAWTDIMDLVLHRLGQDELEQMGKKGKKRVLDEFSEVAMARRMDHEFELLDRLPRRRGGILSWMFLLAVLLWFWSVVIGAAAWAYSRYWYA